MKRVAVRRGLAQEGADLDHPAALRHIRIDGREVHAEDARLPPGENDFEIAPAAEQDAVPVVVVDIDAAHESQRVAQVRSRKFHAARRHEALDHFRDARPPRIPPGRARRR